MLEIVPSMLSPLCPLVSLECVAKCSPDTAALPLELEFPPQKLKRVRCKHMDIHTCIDFFSDDYRSTYV